MTKVINIAELAELAKKNGDTQFSNGDYIIRHLVAGNSAGKSGISLPAAIKIDGVSIFLCTTGETEVTINFRAEKIRTGSILVLSPNDLMEMIDRPQLNVGGYAIFIPIDFAKSLSIDGNALDYNNVSLDTSPILQLDDDNRRLFEDHFNLLELNATINREPSVYTRNISRSLIVAMIYQLMAIANATASARSDVSDRSAPAGGRRKYYVRDFMELLQHDFRKHRSVGHYAGKLFISAKYLSLVIKEATGRTATEWIDHFVILEAKNLLRYSGRNIQQIAYDLNFHNQSAFGKYFKQLTGMSPSQFRKT